MSVVRAGRGVALAAAAALCSAANAADWQFDPSIEVGALSADNYTMLAGSGPKINVAGPFADLVGTLRGRSPRTTLLIEPRVRATVFPGDSDQDSNAGYLSLKLDHIAELTRLGIAANYSNEYIVNSELPQATTGGTGLGQTTGADAGRVTVDNRRQLISANPYLQFTLNQRTRLRFEGTALDVDFDSEVPGSQQSYRSYGISAGAIRDLNADSSLTFSLQHNRYDPRSAGFDSNTDGARLQWDREVAERVTGYLRAGVDRTDGVGPGGAQTVNTPLFGAGAQWTFQRSRLFLDLLRDVEANATGFVVARDEVRLWGTHRFTTRLEGFAALYAVKDEAVADNVAYSPRRYVNASVGTNWRLSREFTLGGQVSHSFQKFQTEDVTANGTTVQASLTWRPNRVD